MDRINVALTPGRLLGTERGGRSKPKLPQVFIAYRMGIDTSREFREQLESHLLAIGPIRVADGRVEDGLAWSKVIRKRIDGSKLFIADMTGPSREVAFEYGYAKNKLPLLVVERDDDRADLPRWITNIQMSPPFGNGNLVHLAENIHRRLLHRESVPQRSKPIPEWVSWISDDDPRDDHLFEVVGNMFRERTSVELRAIVASEIESDDEFRDCQRSWGVIARATGRSSSYLTHFLLGDVASRRTAGGGNRKGESLRRFGIVLDEQTDPGSFVADSAKRVGRPVYCVADEGALLAQVSAAIARYRKWI